MPKLDIFPFDSVDTPCTDHKQVLQQAPDCTSHPNTEMVKRKRGSQEEQSADVGLGATLAYLRGDNAPDNVPPNATSEDNDGWTVVSGSKRRHSSQHSRKHDRNRRSKSPSRHRSPRAQTKDQDDTRVDGHQSPFQTVALENPFATAVENFGSRCSPPENPFSTHKPGSEDPNLSKEERRKARKSDRAYPAIEHSHHARPQSHVKITDLQALVLYLLADGNAPQWVSVRSRASIHQVVMLMVPGLELGMFNGDINFDPDMSIAPSDDEQMRDASTNPDSTIENTATPKRLHISPDDFYPATLRPHRLPSSLRLLSDIFEHVWPIKATGEHRANQYFRVHSPIHTMLTSQIPKTREEKQVKKNGSHKGPLPQNSKHWDNQRTRISEYIATLVDQQENDYIPHPAWFTTAESKEAAHAKRKMTGHDADNGWVDTHVVSLDEADVPEEEVEQGSITAGRHVISVDCEMCKAEDDTLVLARISLLNWDGSVVLDKLVKPTVHIKDYLSQWSGITAAMLENVTTTLSDIQQELLQLITPRTILVGHSLNSDLNALKLTHPFLVDTGILFPHPRGPPYKQSLKWLAQRYLHREVQKGGKGHDSVEDARTCLDLVKQKCEKGPRWGSGETNAESMFKRLGRAMRPKSSNESRAGAVIDWGDPNRGHGGQAHVSIGCKTDEEVVEAVSRAVAGQAEGKDGVVGKVDFVWARLRELELARGWWDDSKTADVEAIRQMALERLDLLKDMDGEDVEVKGAKLSELVGRTVANIIRIHDSLPRCTALIVYSGTGDPREMRRLQGMQQQYRREYATTNWDNLSVKWTDTEVQALSRACQDARNGIGLITVR